MLLSRTLNLRRKCSSNSLSACSTTNHRCWWSSSEFWANVLGLQLLYPLDEITLLETAVTLLKELVKFWWTMFLVVYLVPFRQNLLQIFHFQLLKVDSAEVNLFFVGQLADLEGKNWFKEFRFISKLWYFANLSVGLLQLFANLVAGMMNDMKSGKKKLTLTTYNVHTTWASPKTEACSLHPGSQWQHQQFLQGSSRTWSIVQLDKSLSWF